MIIYNMAHIKVSHPSIPKSFKCLVKSKRSPHMPSQEVFGSPNTHSQGIWKTRDSTWRIIPISKW